MKIFLVGANFGPDSMERHIVLTAERMGHAVAAFEGRRNNSGLAQYLPYRLRQCVTMMAGERSIGRVHRRLVSLASEFDPDIVIVVLGSMIPPDIVRRVRQVTKGPVVCWCQDQLTTMGRQYLIGADYDRVFLKDLYLVRILAEMCGLTTYHLPEACNPSVHRRPDLPPASEYWCDVCTFGSMYPYRQRIFESLRGFDVKLWGGLPIATENRIPDMLQGKRVFEDEKSAALASAKIVVNTLHFGEIDGLNARAFEVAGCGAFQLISDNGAVARYFEVGKEIEVFHSRTELVEKVSYFLAHERERVDIGKAGQERAYREHTYEHRLNEMFAVCGLS